MPAREKRGLARIGAACFSWLEVSQANSIRESLLRRERRDPCLSTHQIRHRQESLSPLSGIMPSVQTPAAFRLVIVRQEAYWLRRPAQLFRANLGVSWEILVKRAVPKTKASRDFKTSQVCATRKAVYKSVNLFSSISKKAMKKVKKAKSTKLPLP